MATKIKVKNGPAEISLEEVVIGDQVLLGIFIEEETAPDVFAAQDLTNYDVTAHVKDNLRNDTEPDFSFTVVKRNQVTERGWVDLTLLGTITSQFTEKEWFGSVRMAPTGTPAAGITVAVITMPAKFRATRYVA